ncbi:DUF5988 family protein [Streptomyces sp. NPDC058701]|uniref:DUF5988 family protein n=1 Tax=Streptomyces sp. NPDC058701 TaxID=3346608 RepID=UPI00365FD916
MKEAKVDHERTLREADEVKLAGGPETLPSVFLLSNANLVDAERLIVTHNGRNEHYVFTEDIDAGGGAALPTARWTYSTAVAE